jgi:hypothetical protein
MRLYGQTKAHVCHYSNTSPPAPSSGQAQNLNASRHVEPHNSTLYQVSRAPLPPLVPASSQGSRDHVMLPQVLVSSSAPPAQVSLSSQVSVPENVSNLSRVSAASSQDPVPPRVSTVSKVLIPPQVSARPPVPAHDSVTLQGATNPRGNDRIPTGQPGGPSAVNYSGPHSVSPTELHSAHPSNELFWYRSDWLRKGCPSNSFITDEHGKPLAYLIKDIRAAARMIWTDIAERPGNYIASSFKRNDHKFTREFVERVEEMHPCLKLCNDHWKALQIGMSSYNYWYKRVWKGDTRHF